MNYRANGVVSGSSRQERQTNPDAQGRKGDFSAYTCDNKLSQLVFLIECKPLRASPSNGFVKMANCFKGCLDKASRTVWAIRYWRCVVFSVKVGTKKRGNEIVTQDSHAVLFIIDSCCKVFAIDLKYHGMYRLIEISAFYLPRDYNSLDVMLGAFQVMNQC